ncbi:MAG: T9SS type A sorting domain-containing protein [Flavobacteriaceae bacterium]
MRYLYLILFFFFLSFSYGQDAVGKASSIEGFKLYPNPTINGKVYISTKAKAPKRILIFDVLGTKVMETTLIREELNVSDLGAGVYLLRVIEKGEVATRKLVIK